MIVLFLCGFPLPLEKQHGILIFRSLSDYPGFLKGIQRVPLPKRYFGTSTAAAPSQVKWNLRRSFQRN